MTFVLRRKQINIYKAHFFNSLGAPSMRMQTQGLKGDETLPKMYLSLGILTRSLQTKKADVAHAFSNNSISSGFSEVNSSLANFPIVYGYVKAPKTI